MTERDETPVSTQPFVCGAPGCFICCGGRPYTVEATREHWRVLIRIARRRGDADLEKRATAMLGKLDWKKATNHG